MKSGSGTEGLTMALDQRGPIPDSRSRSVGLPMAYRGKEDTDPARRSTLPADYRNTNR